MQAMFQIDRGSEWTSTGRSCNPPATFDASVTVRPRDLHAGTGGASERGDTTLYE